MRVEGATVELAPVQAGFELDIEAILEDAMAVGRSPNPVSNFFWWISHLGSTTEVAPRASLEAASLEEVLETLDRSLIGEPPFEGGLAVVEGELVTDYPRPGRRIDRGLRLLSRARYVITDRLHVHILCTLLDIPHCVLDNRYGKIARLSQAFGTRWAGVSQAATLPEAVATAREHLARREPQTA